MLSIDILPVPTDEAARQLQSTLLGVETNVANWQRRQNANNNFTATIPYDMELQRKETKEMLDDLTTRDQRMMFGLVTLVHLADSKEQLDSDTETLYSTARKHLCQLSTLRWQQKDGLDTVLPYGLRKVQALRTLTTESTAVLIPFRAQEIMQPNGLYYGQNAVSKNMIVADRRLLLNGNSFRLGVSGSGKSMSAKEEIVQIALSTEDDALSDCCVSVSIRCSFLPVLPDVVPAPGSHNGVSLPLVRSLRSWFLHFLPQVIALHRRGAYPIQAGHSIGIIHR